MLPRPRSTSGGRLALLGTALLALGLVAIAYLVHVGARVSPGVWLACFGGDLAATGPRRRGIARSVTAAAHPTATIAQRRP